MGIYFERFGLEAKLESIVTVRRTKWKKSRIAKLPYIRYKQTILWRTGGSYDESAGTTGENRNIINHLLQRKRYRPNVGDIKVGGIFYYPKTKQRIGIERIHSDSGKGFQSVF